MSIENENYIYNLIIAKRGYVNARTKNSTNLKYYLEQENLLKQTFNEEQLAIYRRLTSELFTHLDYVIEEEGQYFLAKGIKIGKEIANLINKIDNGTLDEEFDCGESEKPAD